MKALKSLLCLGLVLFFIVIFSAAVKAETIESGVNLAAATNQLPAPTLITPNKTTVTAKVKPLIVGLTKSGSLVKIFIDGVYNGKTEILNHESGTANFAYKPFLNLSTGWHEVYVIAEDGIGGASRRAEVLRFNIELPMPVPIVLKPVVNINTSLSRPFIVGLAKNDSKIKIYIDKKFDGEFLVENHSSGVANFFYKPAEFLERGNHLVYAVAIDKRGKESRWSNLVYFTTKTSDIAQAVREENIQAVASIKEINELPKINSSAPVISESTGAIEEKQKNLDNAEAVKDEQEEAIKKLSRQDEASLEKIKNLIGETAEDEKTGQGLVNEGNLNQAKLKSSLVLFILFLVGVVAWLLWVNRELVKESREKNEAEEKKENTAAGQKDKLL